MINDFRISIRWVQKDGTSFYLESGCLDIIDGKPKSTQLKWRSYFFGTCETQETAETGIRHLKMFYPNRHFEVVHKEVEDE